MKILRYRKTVRELLTGAAMATIGFLFARLHLHVFDKLFIRDGRIDWLIAETNQIFLGERRQTADQRNKNIALAHAQKASGYVLLQSKNFMLFARNALDVATREKVNEVLYLLSDDPNAARRDVKVMKDLKSIRVPGTGYRIAYEVDEENHRVKVYELIRSE
jgi:mRNA-degrading endonuclease RelE of RelBE toxin-antitoxin system